LKCRVSGKFPETAWWAVHSRHAAHALWLISRFLKRNRLAVKLSTARQHIPVLPNFMDFYEGHGSGD